MSWSLVARILMDPSPSTRSACFPARASKILASRSNVVWVGAVRFEFLLFNMPQRGFRESGALMPSDAENRLCACLGRIVQAALVEIRNRGGGSLTKISAE